MDNEGHEYTCPVGGVQDSRHRRVGKWAAQKITECWGGRVREEIDVDVPLVRSAGRMDIVADRFG